MVDYSNLFSSGLKAIGARPHTKSMSLDIKATRRVHGPLSPGAAPSFKTIDGFGYEPKGPAERTYRSRWRFMNRRLEEPPSAPPEGFPPSSPPPSYEDAWIDLGDGQSIIVSDYSSLSDYSDDSYEDDLPTSKYPAYLDPLASSISALSSPDDTKSFHSISTASSGIYPTSKIADESFLSLSTTSLVSLSRGTSRSSGVFPCPVVLMPEEPPSMSPVDMPGIGEDPMQDWRRFHVELLDGTDDVSVV